MKNGRETFSSNYGFILSCIGAAVGLGAVWKFPYTVGQYGGGAFLLIFLIALMVIATPILMIEFAIGRKTKLNYQGALKKLFPGKKWYLIGIVGLVALIIVLSFYMGVSGWTLAYLFKSIMGSYASLPAEEIANNFGEFLNSPVEILFWQLTMTVCTGVIVAKGIQNGIEKVSKVLIPMLLIMIIVLGVKAITLPGAQAGLEFYLKPDFGALSVEGILAAIGLAFFTLGVGTGNLVIFGSYLDSSRTVASSTFIVVLSQVFVAILMGFIIFPGVFAYGVEPSSGPPLVFITLPIIFAQMDFGMFFAILFYLLLFFACLTSTIAILEAIVGYFVDEWKWARKKTVFITLTGIYLIGVFQMLSFGPLSDVTIFGKTIFDLSDYIVTNILLPGGGLALLIFTGWMWKPKLLFDEINIGKGIKMDYRSFHITVKFIAPIALLIVYLQLLGIIKV